MAQSLADKIGKLDQRARDALEFVVDLVNDATEKRGVHGTFGWTVNVNNSRVSIARTINERTFMAAAK